MAFKKFVCSVAALFLLCQATCFASQHDTLSDLANSGKPVKVFIREFANESGQAQINAGDFKDALEKAFLNRKSVTFEVVKDPSESDVRVSGIIKRYLYSINDPINSFAGPSGLVLDAVTSENYVEMIVEFEITGAKKGDILWKNEIKSYVERPMTPEQSIPIIYEKISRNFVAKSFGKPGR